MRFMLLLFQKETFWIERDIVRKVVAWKRRLSEQGIFITGSPLKPDGLTNTLVPNVTGETELQEGPLKDDELSLFAFEMINATSMDHAIEIARTHPACGDQAIRIEIREIWDTVDDDLGH